MEIYLAGVQTRPYVIGGGKFYGDIPSISSNEKELAQRYSATDIRGGKIEDIIDKSMEIYFAGEHPCKNGKGADWTDINILESYYYLRRNNEFARLIGKVGNFLLDSGAFTFMMGSKEKIDWDIYVEEYAEFINKFNIEHFFELDIDSIVGLKEVERLRAKLEALTGKKPIPVWHKNRGLKYFEQMCKKYPYVAIGGIVAKEIPIEKYEKAFPWFIDIAHKNEAKIHGLGYTRLSNLKKYHFDSVDSTAWLYGNRGGYLYRFNPNSPNLMEKYDNKDARLKSKESAVYNFNEWIKLQNFARRNL